MPIAQLSMMHEKGQDMPGPCPRRGRVDSCRAIVSAAIGVKVDLAPADISGLATTGQMVQLEGERWMVVTLDQRDPPTLRIVPSER